MGPVRLSPAIIAAGRFSGAGLSMQAGQNWYAQVGLGRTYEPAANFSGVAPMGAVNISAGYRWSDGDSLSLLLTRPRGERLGLSVSYDWTRYFLRMSYEPGLSLTPADMVRFSAGLKF
jgi:hypothetical protein